MSENKLTANVRRVSPFACVIDIVGEINSFTEGMLTQAYQQAAGGNTPTILFNFTGMSYLNSLGIGMLVVLLVRAQREKKNIAGFGLSEHYRKIFELTRLDQVIPIYSTEEIALAAAERYDLPERES